ncbi:MAG: Glu/Leu/Phe/Val dehydrogenase [Ignavibacteriae bacterium]|nr:Glu/Leu/Phe/Val dehydrogenase [Ignavibacteriota bacterium]
MSTSSNLLSITPQEFVLFLKQQNIRRCYFVFDSKTKTVKSSHLALKHIAEFFQSDTRDFNTHEGIFLQVSDKHDTLQGAFVHRTWRGQAAGGVRYWSYHTMEEYLRDGLRLAKGMTHKNALAGLWWGGGKGVMAHNPNVEKFDENARSALYQEFGEMMTSLQGCYVTAEDVGTHVADMANVFSKTRFTTCIPPSLGGSGNPSVPTARGVVCGMEAALEFLGEKGLEGKIVAVQGMGNVGAPLIKFLFEKKVEKVIACDINQRLAGQLTQELAGKNFVAKVVPLCDHNFFATECDILSPCATGAVLNLKSIPLIKAKMVCGAANNQLEDHVRDDAALFQRGIVYVPDFLTNRMGIVTCANEQYGYVNNDPAIEQHLNKDWEFSIHQVALKVLRESKAMNVPPSSVALKMADELSFVPHPIFGHRGQEIIDSLVANGWERS